jgi:hypothetical protein
MILLAFVMVAVPLLAVRAHRTMKRMRLLKAMRDYYATRVDRFPMLAGPALSMDQYIRPYPMAPEDVLLS